MYILKHMKNTSILPAMSQTSDSLLDDIKKNQERYDEIHDLCCVSRWDMYHSPSHAIATLSFKAEVKKLTQELRWLKTIDLYLVQRQGSKKELASLDMERFVVIRLS